MDLNDFEAVKTEFNCFDLHHNITEEYLIHPRAGILILTKKDLKPFVDFLPTSEVALFFKIKKDLLNSEKDLLCSCIYFPPSSSLYAVPECYEKLENDLIDTKDNHDCNTLIFGDFNAITKNWADTIQHNKYDFSEDLEDIPDDIPRQRQNQDLREPDQHGKDLLEFCKVG